MDIPTQTENPEGLHSRFVIRKITGWRKEGFEGWRAITKAADPKAEYFVMRLDESGSDINHIKACRIGIHAYANAIEPHIPQLAKDLRERYPLLPSQESDRDNSKEAQPIIQDSEKWHPQYYPKSDLPDSKEEVK